jgi:membrane protein DedA with SNARE-associated domain/rhodanese-related sulfurtransferase
MGAETSLTYSGIGLAVFAQQFCLPVPALLLLMTAGALAARGELHMSLVLLASVIGCLAADGFWFWLGRRWGSGVIRLVCSFTADPNESRERSQRIFKRWGLRLLLVAKFVPGLDGVSPPLVGAEGASIRNFMAYDTAGSLLWSLAFVSFGYGFSSQVDKVMRLMSRFGLVIGLLVGVPLLCFVLWRLMQLVRMIRHLRLRRISPGMLQQKIDASPLVAIFDLLEFEAREGGTEGIPGAVRVNPTRFRKAPRFAVPDGMAIVLYCSSRNEFVSARVAKSLEERGIHDVWVLEGGLEGWRRDGRAVTLALSSPEEVAARLGIVLPPEMHTDAVRN